MQFSSTRKLFVDTLVWLFEEAVPLSLDTPALLTNGNSDVYQDVLRRLLHIFIRLQKKNYVASVVYMLGALPQILQSPTGSAFKDVIGSLVSDDLEILQSLLRGATNYTDNEAQISRKALLLTARSETAFQTLQTWADLRKEVQDADTMRRHSSIGPRSTLIERFEPAVEAIGGHLTVLFANLCKNDFNVHGSATQLQGQKAKTGLYVLSRPSSAAEIALDTPPPNV